MTETNDLRAELEVDLCGKKYVLKLNLDAIRRVERITGAGWTTLVRRAFDGEMMIDDIAGVIWGGIFGYDPETDITFDDVVNMVYREGVIKTNPPVRELLLLQAIGADRESKIAGEVEGAKKEEENGKLSSIG